MDQGGGERVSGPAPASVPAEGSDAFDRLMRRFLARATARRRPAWTLLLHLLCVGFAAAPWVAWERATDSPFGLVDVDRLGLSELLLVPFLPLSHPFLAAAIAAIALLAGVRPFVPRWLALGLLLCLAPVWLLSGAGYSMMGAEGGAAMRDEWLIRGLLCLASLSLLVRARRVPILPPGPVLLAGWLGVSALLSADAVRAGAERIAAGRPFCVTLDHGKTADAPVGTLVELLPRRFHSERTGPTNSFNLDFQGVLEIRGEDGAPEAWAWSWVRRAWTPARAMDWTPGGDCTPRPRFFDGMPLF